MGVVEVYDIITMSKYQETQVSRILRRFGSAQAFHEALKDIGSTYTVRAIRFWNSRGGLIPKRAVPAVQLAADIAGIILTDADWRPN